MTDLEKVLGKTGARKFWDNVWRNVKILTGDVAYNTKGDLQTQINAVADTASTAKTTADAAKTAAEDAKVAAGEIVTDTTDKFDSTKDYAVGDYVIYDNKAWKFTTVHPAGAWDESHVEQTNILAEIAAQNKNFAELDENLPFAFGIDKNGNYGYIKAGADTVTPFKTGDVNAVHGFCWNQNESENTYMVGLVSLLTNKVFKVESNSIVFLKSISKATLKLHVKLCGAGSYWTAYLDYALNSNWKNIASNYNGNGLSSGTYWTVSKDISIPLTNIKAGDKIAFRSRTNKTSCRLISMTCVLDQS